MRNFRGKPNAYAFIDSQNLNLGVQKAGWKLDWKKFREYLAQEYNVTRAYLFIGYIAENEAMYNQLHEAGYSIVLKPTVETSIAITPEEQAKSGTKEDRKPVIKGNIDAELVLYAMKEMPNYKKAIIVSGDGDFACLAEYMADKKRLLHVMTPNWQYSSLLKPYDKYIVRIDTLRKQLEHRDFRRKKPKTAPTA
jgi:uncharacterized LabA/DUF88 family protein